MPSSGHDLVSFLSSYRETVIRETGNVLLNAKVESQDYRAEAFGRVASLLASSLEELRVAEEELVERNGVLLAQHQEAAHRVAYERRLFDCAPCALIATTLTGSITEANKAAASLFGYSAGNLIRKPVASLVPLEDRPTFRIQFNRISISEGATDWHFRLMRLRDKPVRVSAAIQVVGHADPSGGAGLIWSLRALENSEDSPTTM
jgi:PAS domain S-box-containing protein